MSDVFISHAHETLVRAKAVADALRADGFDVWYDEDLPAHRAFSEVIEERLRAAKAVIVIWSAEATKSQWVRAEADTARKAGTLIQLRVDGSELPLPFSQVQCVDLAGWSGDIAAPGWRKVIASVEELLGRKAASEPESAKRDVRAKPPVPLWISLAAVAAGAMLLAAGIAFWTTRSSTAVAVQTPAVATVRVSIPPFDAAGQSAESRNLADTLTNQIGDALSANQVAVALPSAGVTKSRLLLSGTVRDTEQKTITVRVRLDDVVQGTTLWSRSFQGPAAAEDVLRVQVAGRSAYEVITAASPTLNPVRNQPGLLASVLELIDASADQWGSARSVVLARDLVSHSAQIAFSHVLLAQTLYSYAKYNLPPQSQAPFIDETNREAAVALKLDPASGIVEPVLAAMTPFSDWGRRENYYLKAIGTGLPDPRRFITGRYCFSLLMSGRNQDALGEARSAAAVEPFGSGARDCLAFALLATGQRQEASTLMNELMHEWPDNVGVWADALLIGLASEPVNNELLQACLDSPIKSHVPEPYYALWQRVVRSLNASPTERNVTAQIVVTAADHRSFSMPEAVGALTRLGHVDDAFSVARRIVALNIHRPYAFDPVDTTFLFAPGGEALRQDRRFMALAAQLDLVDYWRRSGHWPDFCSEPGLPYDCKIEASKSAGAAH